MTKYRFETIKPGESREYRDCDLAKVRGSALKFAKYNGVRIRTEKSADGESLIVTVLRSGDGCSTGKTGKNIYRFDEYMPGDVRKYMLGDVIDGRKIVSLYRVRAAALKYGQRHGIVFKTVIGFEPNTIHVKRFS